MFKDPSSRARRRLAWCPVLIAACAFFAADVSADEPMDAATPRLVDFSGVGYRGGEATPRSLPVTLSIVPEAGDDRERVQAAIDGIGAREPDADGHRGVLLLKAGRYEVGGPLKIAHSGVVLRGEGTGATGTILFATLREKHKLLEVGGEGRRTLDRDRTHRLAADAVAGERTFTLGFDDAFAAGDAVVLKVTPNAAWVASLGMDLINEFGEKSNDWDPKTYAMEYERRVVSAEGDRVTLDAPVPVRIRAANGGAVLAAFTWPERITEVGLENLQLASAFDAGVTQPHFFTEETTLADEDHAWTGVEMDNVADAWVRNVVATGFGGCAFRTQRGSVRITFEDSAALDPVAQVRGGRRYGWSLGGGLTLVRNGHTRGQRHDYAMHMVAPGPNAFADCLGEDSFDQSEPHHRWATGVLYDNVCLTGRAIACTYAPCVSALKRYASS